MAGRLLSSLHEYGLLDLAQYGFVVDGSCVEPLTLMARLFESGRGPDGEEVHVVCLDATSAFDSVPHTALDAALRRLGAPSDFIAWMRAMLSGHRRVAATAYEVDGDGEAEMLEGGCPQGCPSSPAIGVIVVDYALSVLRQWDGGGVRVGDKVLRCLAFADDMALAAHTKEEVREATQTLVAAMGAIGVRFNARKSYYTWSGAAARAAGREPTELPVEPLAVNALDADGRWREMALTSVPPRGTPDGETLEE